MKLEDYSEATQKQWMESDTYDYKYHIKSCYNCQHWMVGFGFHNEYAYNSCINMLGTNGWTVTKFDFWCPNYVGCMEERNLLCEEHWGVA